MRAFFFFLLVVVKSLKIMHQVDKKEVIFTGKRNKTPIELPGVVSD